MQQILQRLFKVAHEQATDSTSPPSNKETDQEGKSKEIVINLVENRRHSKIRSDHETNHTKLGCKNFKVFSFLCRRYHASKTCFYSTLNLRRVNHSFKSSTTSQQQTMMTMILSMKMKKLQEPHKVLPVMDTPLSSSDDKVISDKVKAGEKISKPMSRMKELLRWAAATKSEKGGKFMIGRKVLQMRNWGRLKAVTGDGHDDDDQLSLESPKISFRWEVESSYSTSTDLSGISMAASSKNDKSTFSTSMLSLNSTPLIHDIDYSATRKGNWITTDSEFVVLEL